MPLQFLRAPSMLHEYHKLHSAMGGEISPTGKHLEDLFPQAVQLWLYRWSLERGFLDSLLIEYVVTPFVRVLRWCDGMERRWTDLLSHGPSRESDQVQRHFGEIEELT